MPSPTASKRLYIKTYGCQMNVYDSSRMADVLKPLGYSISQGVDEADLIILNTCHIREKAEEKMFSDLGRVRPLKAGDKKPLIAVGGCVAQAEGAEIMRRAPYVDMVFGPQTYHQLPELVTRALRGQGQVVALDFPEITKFDHLPEPDAAGSASAFLSVQEGCDKFCTFCVVPYTRGAEYSRPPRAILSEARALAAQGVVEITLLGQNVNAYHGEDENGNVWSLAQLISALATLPEIKRIRYTTSHPRDMADDLIATHRDEEKLMPYLHLPVQSGSDSVLKRMNRKHTAAHYVEIMHRLREARPDIAFSSDFIVGFPGETDREFEDTLKLVETVGYAQAYSFKYSPRPGTPAATDEAQLPESVKDERLQTLQALLVRQQIAFNAASQGKTFDVLFEKPGKHRDQWIGKSPYLQSVHVISPGVDLRGRLLPVRVTGAYQNSLAGELVNPRHCERSEAIQDAPTGWIASSLRSSQ